MDAISVTQLVRKMKTALQFEVGEVWVEGEVSNLRVQRSGHRYFTIKDEGAQLSCVLFKGRSRGAGELIQDGHKVQLFGEVTIYEAMGRAQMVVQKVEAAGAGDLQAQFEALKQKLNSEGLFDPSHKKPLPEFPQRIGLITSPSGAALQDMLHVFSRRAPWVQLSLYGVQVQGKGAERGIAHAIRAFNAHSENGLPAVDVLIIGRGGGSTEDLWNFNEEVVARAIFESEIPLISAVGHEIDFTISDFVSDQRAPTPSAAAEIAVPDREALLQAVHGASRILKNTLLGRLQEATQKLTYLSQALERRSPTAIHREKAQLLGDLQERLNYTSQHTLLLKQGELLRLKAQLSQHSPKQLVANYTDRLSQLKAHLQSAGLKAHSRKKEELQLQTGILRALSPEATLARGYSITTTAEGQILTDSDTVKAGVEIKTTLAQGEVTSTVQ